MMESVIDSMHTRPLSFHHPLPRIISHPLHPHFTQHTATSQSCPPPHPSWALMTQIFTITSLLHFPAILPGPAYLTPIFHEVLVILAQTPHQLGDGEPNTSPAKYQGCGKGMEGYIK